MSFRPKLRDNMYSLTSEVVEDYVKEGILICRPRPFLVLNFSLIRTHKGLTTKEVI